MAPLGSAEQGPAPCVTGFALPVIEPALAHGGSRGSVYVCCMTRSLKMPRSPGSSSDEALFLGCHLSISDGYHKAGLSALSIGANTFQFFSRNPRGSKAKEPLPGDIERLGELTREHGFGPLLAHAPYTLNPCSQKETVRDFAKTVLREDLEKLARFPHTYYVMHPGSRGEMALETAIEFLGEALDEALEQESSVMVLLEGMSGKGSEVGGALTELKDIIDSIERNEFVGVCLDTCHLYAAGYDIVNDLDGVVAEIDSTVGLDRVKAVHINDSQHELGSKKDRHARVGEGDIGLEAILRFISHPALRGLTFNLETPGTLESWAEEIALLRKGWQPA